MTRTIALFLALFALALPAAAQEAVLPGDSYPQLVACYVAYEQDKGQAQVRGDNARVARRTAQIKHILLLLAHAGQAVGKTKDDVQRDIQAGMTDYFNKLASGEIKPEDLPAQVQACEAWIEAEVTTP